MAVKFRLATTGMQRNMLSSWTDDLYCSILKDGSISLRPSKEGEDEYGGRWWFPSRRGIMTPKQFVDAIYAIDEIEAGNWSIQDDMLPVLFEHAPLFASLTNLYIEIEDNQEEEDLDFSFSVKRSSYLLKLICRMISNLQLIYLKLSSIL